MNSKFVKEPVITRYLITSLLFLHSLSFNYSIILSLITLLFTSPPLLSLEIGEHFFYQYFLRYFEIDNTTEIKKEHLRGSSRTLTIRFLYVCFALSAIVLLRNQHRRFCRFNWIRFLTVHWFPPWLASGGLHFPNSASLFPTVIAVSLLCPASTAQTMDL